MHIVIVFFLSSIYCARRNSSTLPDFLLCLLILCTHTAPLPPARDKQRTNPPHQKAIDNAIAKRFDAVLAEQEAPSPTPSSSSDAAPTPTSSSDAIALSVKAEDDAPVRPPKPKKLKTSVDEDARLAAELHAQWNSGRPSRATKKGAAGGTAAAKKRGKKSERLVHSDGEEEGGDAAGKTKKRKRKANPNSPFNMPMVLSEPLAGFLGESQVRDYARAGGLVRSCRWRC